MDFVDWLRGMNVVLGLAVFAFLFARVMLVWKSYSYSQKMVFAALVLFVSGNTVRAFELILVHADFSITILCFLVGNTLLLIYLAEPESMYQKRLGRDLRSR